MLPRLVLGIKPDPAGMYCIKLLRSLAPKYVLYLAYLMVRAHTEYNTYNTCIKQCIKGIIG